MTKVELDQVKAFIAVLESLEPKFAPFSPTQQVAFPSIDRAQCEVLRELVASAKAGVQTALAAETIE